KKQISSNSFEDFKTLSQETLLNSLLKEYYYLVKVRRNLEAQKLFNILDSIRALNTNTNFLYPYFHVAMGLGDANEVKRIGSRIIQIDPNQAEQVAITTHNHFSEVQNWLYWDITSQF